MAKRIHRELQEKIIKARLQLITKSERQKSPPAFKQVAAEVHGNETRLLKDSPDADAELEKAKRKFRSKWKLEQVFASDIIIPSDSPTLKLLYGEKQFLLFGNCFRKNKVKRFNLDESVENKYKIKLSPRITSFDQKLWSHQTRAKEIKEKYLEMVYGNNLKKERAVDKRAEIMRLKARILAERRAQTPMLPQYITNRKDKYKMQDEVNPIAREYQRNARKLSPKNQRGNVKTRLMFMEGYKSVEPELRGEETISFKKNSEDSQEDFRKEAALILLAEKIGEVSTAVQFRQMQTTLQILSEITVPDSKCYPSLGVRIIKNLIRDRLEIAFNKFKVFSKKTIGNKKLLASVFLSEVLNGITGKVLRSNFYEIAQYRPPCLPNELSNVIKGLVFNRLRNYFVHLKTALYTLNKSDGTTNNVSKAAAKCISLVFHKWKYRIVHHFLEKCKLVSFEEQSQRLKARMFAGILGKVLKCDQRIRKAFTKWRRVRERRVASIFRQITERLKMPDD